MSKNSGRSVMRRQVRREVADVEAPHDGPLDLGPALAAHLVEVGVVPEVVDGAREAAVAVEQRRRLRDRAPAVQLVLGVEREVHADVLAPVASGRLACPRRRHHQRGARGHAVAEGVVDADVAGVAGPEVVAADDDEAGVGPVAEAFGEGGHAPDDATSAAGRYPPAGTPKAEQAPHSPSCAARAAATAARKLVGVGDVRRDAQHVRRSPAGQLEVHEQPVAGPVDVGEQAPVLVPCLDVALQADRRALGRSCFVNADAASP